MKEIVVTYSPTVTKNMVWKIADLGLARIEDLNNTQTVCGTRGHMAPEIMTGRYDGKVDIWSTAATFIYHLRSLVSIYLRFGPLLIGFDLVSLVKNISKQGSVAPEYLVPFRSRMVWINQFININILRMS